MEIKSSLLNDEDFKFVKSSIIKASQHDGSEENLKFRVDLVEWINDASYEDDDEFFYEMVDKMRFWEYDENLLDHFLNGAAYTKPDKRLYFNAPDGGPFKIGKDEQMWEFIYDHECLHQLWDTFGVEEKLKSEGVQVDHDLMNIASDCVINDYLRDVRKKKGHKNMIFPEYLKQKYGVEYNRKKDTQYTLYLKMVEKAEEIKKDKFLQDQIDKLDKKLKPKSVQQGDGGGGGGPQQKHSEDYKKGWTDAIKDALGDKVDPTKFTPKEVKSDYDQGYNDAMDEMKQGLEDGVQLSKGGGGGSTGDLPNIPWDTPPQDSQGGEGGDDSDSPSQSNEDANDAQKSADKAQEAADKAKEAAQKAQDNADQAKQDGSSSAGQKQRAADDAKDAAQRAQEAADRAQEAADKAKEAKDGDNSDAEKEASQEAGAAQETAENAAQEAQDAAEGKGSQSDGEFKDAQDAAEQAQKAAEEAQQSAEAAKEAASEAKSSGSPDAKEKEEIAKDAEKAAKEAKDAAEKAKKAAQRSSKAKDKGNDSRAEQAEAEAKAEATKAKDAATKAKKRENEAKGNKTSKEGKSSDHMPGDDENAKPKKNPPSWGDSSEGDLVETPEDLEKIKKEAQKTIEKYKNKLTGTFGHFISQCKESVKMNPSGLGVGAPKASKGWDDKMFANVMTFVKNKVFQKQRQYQYTYSRVKRGSGFIKYGQPIQPGKKIREEKLTISVGIYIDVSGSMMGDPIDNAWKSVYIVCESLKKRFAREKIVDDIAFKIYAWDTSFEEVKYGNRVNARGGTMSFEQLLDGVKKRTGDFLINIILTDAGFSVDPNRVKNFLKDMKGKSMVNFITNCESYEVKKISEDKEYSTTLFYILANSDFGLSEDMKKRIGK